jgi:hypothetical protein
MNKQLAHWLKERMTRIDERVTRLEDHALNGERAEW